MAGVFWLLISVVHQRSDGWAASSPIRRGKRHRARGGTMSSSMGELKLELQCTKSDDVSHLRDLDYERNLFCPFTTAKPGHKRRSIGRRLGRWWGLPPAMLQLHEVVQRVPRGLLLLLGQFNGSNRWWIAWIWWRLGFGGFQVLRAKIQQTRATIYGGSWSYS
jgi:hypothetical protein